MIETAIPSAADRPLIRIVDDDTSFRRALLRLLQAYGYRVQEYSSVGDMLLAGIGPECGCFILDIHMPGPSGLDLQAMLVADEHPLPIIFVTGEATVHDSLRAMKAGATDFLLKPVDPDVLLPILEKALQDDAHLREAHRHSSAIKARYATLSPRERQVLHMVVVGAMNKQISAALEVAERTVKAHRAQVMHKMDVRTLADLVRVAEQVQDELDADCPVPFQARHHH